MASEQAVKEERSEDAGRLDRESDQPTQHPTGVIETIQEGTKSILKAVKEAAGGKAHDPSDTTREGAYVSGDREAMGSTAGGKMGEYKEYTAEKGKEGKDSTTSKLGEYKDYTADKAKQGKDATMEKMEESKDYTAEKAKEGKDYNVQRLTELKESAMDAARRAMELLSSKKEETKQKVADTGEAAKEKMGESDEGVTEKMEELKSIAEEYKKKMGEVEEAARQKLEELKLKGKEYKEKGGGHRAGEAKDTETTERQEDEARGSILSTIKEKLMGSSEEAEQRREQTKKYNGGEVKAEGLHETVDTPVDASAATFKTSDQMSGQTFNDVGRMGEEGTGRRDRDPHGKI
ncbi:late embryogenesis abundant protein ECP63-like [Macadamia integrifolia]|uniref:late embryogenesis abundant protein ECP63-like n=1 Tax=Macadamia integrifolia TaxID=60698 RepID=UPI001C528EA9|nr:late embryogenesis abundant protein ECP63-like [Macadamia integrifolia]